MLIGMQERSTAISSYYSALTEPYRLTVGLPEYTLGSYGETYVKSGHT
jgi:hypothetical protein